MKSASPRASPSPSLMRMSSNSSIPIEGPSFQLHSRAATPAPASGTMSPRGLSPSKNATCKIGVQPNRMEFKLIPDIDPIEILPNFQFRSLPTPLHPSKCPLLCCFYGEFDNTVGPMVCSESPEGFMGRDVGITIEEAQQILCTLFSKVQIFQRTTSDNPKNRSVTDDMSPSYTETNQPKRDQAEQRSFDKDDKASNTVSNSCSIFDATSDYIITGSELADQVICVSTHNIHLMTMSTSIVDARYERNSLLFSVGFVIRREEDIIWPFRGPLSKIVSTFKTMEIETQFLSKPRTRGRIQSILEAILISLNSGHAEANLLLDDANQLNLKLFRPPRTLAHRVPDYLVPVLLRPEWQLQMFDWDLTINWIIPHIDGIKCTRLIAKESEMDDEMCAACLRVLKHHGVIAFVDIFRYSNVYESTPLASAMLNGQASKLLNLAYHFTAKAPAEERTQFTPAPLSSSPVGLDLSRSGHSLGLSAHGIKRPILNSIHSPSPMEEPRPSSFGAHPSALHSYSRLSTGHSMSPSPYIGITFAPSSYPPRNGQRNSLDPITPHDSQNHVPLPPKGRHMIKCALAQLYSSCKRSTSFGDVLLSKLEKDTGTAEYSELDWKVCLDSIDHRRFITFGIIHGLIRRVYCFPFAFSAANENSGDTPSNPGFTDGSSSVSPEQEISATSRYEEITKEDEPDDPLAKFAENVAQTMDGTKCDDDLTCRFETPLPELIEMVNSYTPKTVAFVYSTMRL